MVRNGHRVDLRLKWYEGLNGFPRVSLAVAACLCGWVLSKVGMPAAWLIGPMIAAVVFALRGSADHLTIPQRAFQVAQAIVGIALASSVEPSNMRVVGEHWFSVAVVGIGTLVISISVGLLVSLVGKVEVVTSLLGALPGGAASMVAMSESVAADTRLVAVMQYMRVIMVVLSAALGARMISHGQVMHSVGASNPVNSVSLWECLFTIVIALAGMWIGMRLKLPAGALLGAMIFGMGLNALGVLHLQLPPGVIPLAYAVIGVYVGSLFDRASVKHAGVLVPYFLGSGILLIVSCTGLGWILSRVSGVDFITCYLGASPGGIDAISMTAMGSGANLSLVVVLQTVRMMVIIVMGPMVVRWVSRQRKLGP